MAFRAFSSVAQESYKLALVSVTSGNERQPRFRSLPTLVVTRGEPSLPDVKNRRGKQARSRKVTGVACQPGVPGRLLVTCNDSRVRLYDGYALRRKFKGPANRRAA